MQNVLKINKAKQFAKELYKKHNRLTGENYYEHCLRVFGKLKRLNIDSEEILIAALLHQAFTFSDVRGEIEKQFGSEVAQIIENYKKLSDRNITTDSKGEFNEKYIVQTYINLADDLKALLIRLADKVDNIETAYALPKRKRKIVALKALNLYAPIARLLGLMQITNELENGAFKALHPDQYYKIETAVKEKRNDINKFFGDTLGGIKSLLKEKGIEAKIYGRIKGIYSIHRKALHLANDKGKKVGSNFEGLHDFAAMRIITDTVEDCYAVEDVLRQLWDSGEEARDDYIQMPKANGYQSIHAYFEVAENFSMEVQIRTQEMHDYNEYGAASHTFYKIGEKFKHMLEKDPNWLKSLQQWKAETALKEKESKIQKFGDNVYSFTPKGDIIELPKGSTVLDFAYAIHSKLGHRCIGASVNDKIEKLTYKIRDGDKIEIRTLRKKKKPSADWLDIVKTYKARSAIKKALNKKETS